MSQYSRTCLERLPHWPQKYGLSRQVVSGDRFSYIEMKVLLPKVPGLSRQVVSHGSGLSRQLSLYIFITLQLNYQLSLADIFYYKL